MSKVCRHIVFETAWGFFGLSGIDGRLRYSSLPVGDRAAATRLIMAGRPDSRYDATAFRDMRECVTAYFEGVYVDFSEAPLDLATSTFGGRVLSACRKIPYGQTASYARLACLAGSPQAARAAGSVMAGNPLPLIIPCHRIIRADGRVGCFSATGGPELKTRLLALEAQGVHAVAR